jgi:SAM-dependent methyltransferase
MNAPRRVLDIGCGDKKVEGAIGIDVVGSTAADVVCDLTVFPWPLEGDRFDEVFANNVIEHLPDVVKTMEEIHRVCRQGAVVHIKTPHFAALESWEDPTHLHHFAFESFDYFAGGGRRRHVRHYTEKRFRVLRKRLHFGGHPFSWIGRVLFAISPRGYEKRWCFWFRPSTLEIDLTVEKMG